VTRPAGSTGDGPLERLARRLQAGHAGLSFSRAKRVIAAGQVRVDGRIELDPGAWVDPGSTVEWNPSAPTGSRAVASAVEIVHADAHVVVVVKPAGLLSVPTRERERDTLLSHVARRLARRQGRRPFLGVVQRLDRDTSGLMVLAATRGAEQELQGQLADRSLSRGYEAVVVGVPEAAAGTIDRELVGDGLRRRRGVADPGERGKPALTHWRVLERFAGSARLSVTIETGRTHQIRIHLASIGHPVVGDRVYRAPDGTPPPAWLDRQALHAAHLAFLHPATGRRMEFETPPPEDLARLIDRLRRDRMGG